MTSEQIFELAKTCGFDNFMGRADDGTKHDYRECWGDQLIKFTQKIYEKGYNERVDYTLSIANENRD